MTKIGKTIAIFMILLLFSAFILGNTFANYKAEKLAAEYKTQAVNSVTKLEEKYTDVLWQQKLGLIRSMLSGENKYNLENLVSSDEGIYVIRLQSQTQDTKSNLEQTYLSLINDLEQKLSLKQRYIIIHAGGGVS